LVENITGGEDKDTLKAKDVLKEVDNPTDEKKRKTSLRSRKPRQMLDACVESRGLPGKSRYKPNYVELDVEDLESREEESGGQFEGTVTKGRKYYTAVMTRAAQRVDFPALQPRTKLKSNIRQHLNLGLEEIAMASKVYSTYDQDKTHPADKHRRFTNSTSKPSEAKMKENAMANRLREPQESPSSLSPSSSEASIVPHLEKGESGPYQVTNQNLKAALRESYVEDDFEAFSNEMGGYGLN
jgi:hypothetical protein